APSTAAHRQPNVPIPIGDSAVSPWVTRIRASGVPSSRDTICAQVVWWPWPLGPVPMITVAVPSGLTRTRPEPLNADGNPYSLHEKPRSTSADGPKPHTSTYEDSPRPT